jgi:adenosine deaminase
METSKNLIKPELTELHAHLAPSISPAIYWQIAHTEGYILPRRDYSEFEKYVQLSPDRKMTLKEYLDEIYHPLLDKLSSGSVAVEKAVYETMSGAHRANNITVMELRLNPMKHNHGGDVDLDHVIMATLRGMERALLEYSKLRAGIVFIMDRHFSFEKNAIIVEKAIKYSRRGVVGIDMANYNSDDFHYKDYRDLVKKARTAGLKITAHTGETLDTNDMWECLDALNPERIGHGIRAAYDQKLMDELVKRSTVLEVCPLSNVMTKAVKDAEEMKFILQTFVKNGVKFCINTDWPEAIKDAHLTKQFEFLREYNILTEKEIATAIATGFQATFVPKKPDTNLYL